MRGGCTLPLGPGTCTVSGWVEGLARHRSRVLLVAALCTAAVPLALPRLHLSTDIVELLPRTADAGSPSQDYRVFLDRFGSFEKVFVMAVGSPESTPCTDELATLLAEHPEVSAVRSGIEPEDERFFLEQVIARAPLLLGDDWRTRVESRLEPAAIDARVRSLRNALTQPGGSFVAAFATHDPLGFAADLDLPAVDALPVDPVDGAFRSTDGDVGLVVLTPSRGELDPDAGRRLQGVIDGACAQACGASTVRCVAVGGPLYAAHDEASIREDLQRTITGTALGCGVILLLAFGGPRIPAVVLLTVLVGLGWTAAALAWTHTSLAAVSLGFAAVLVGLGVDYGIHGGVRFFEARSEGFDRIEAVVATVRRAGPGIGASALTTAAAFAVLAQAHFRPLGEVGILVASGILSILVAAVTVGIACLLTGDGEAETRPHDSVLWRGLGRFSEGLAHLGRRRPRAVVAVALGLTALAAWGAARLELRADPRSLRPVDHPLLEAEALLTEAFDLGTDTSTLVVRGDDLGQAMARAQAAAGVVRRLAPEVALTAPLEGLADADPSRLVALAELPLASAVEVLEDRLRDANLNPRAFAPGFDALRALAAGHDPRPPDPADWPTSVHELVRLDDDGAWVALRLRAPAGVWDDGPPQALRAEIRRVAPGAAVASVPALGRELQALAKADLRRLGGLALVVVLLVVGLSFRDRPWRDRPWSLLATLLPVTLGTLWTCGLLGWWGGPLDLVGLAVVPILLGIGIDDGLHAVHGARRGPSSLAESTAAAGRAMALTTLTTAVGFGSLLMSQIPGLRQGGFVVAVGVVACLLATLVVLPALGALAGSTDGKSHDG